MAFFFYLFSLIHWTDWKDSKIISTHRRSPSWELGLVMVILKKHKYINRAFSDDVTATCNWRFQTMKFPSFGKWALFLLFGNTKMAAEKTLYIEFRSLSVPHTCQSTRKSGTGYLCWLLSGYGDCLASTCIIFSRARAFFLARAAAVDRRRLVNRNPSVLN